MEYLILIPMKKAYELDLVKYLKVAINTQYGNVDDKTKECLESLNRMRNNATSKTIDTRQEHSLDIIEKYYDQVVLLSNKLPQADIPFKWKDAFEKGGYLFSSGSLTVSNLGYEKICLLFNIGALMSNLGAYYGKEGSFNDQSLKQAIKHFQGAAGIFQALKHTTCSSANTNDLTFDLQSEVLNLLQHIMLAQAQEAFFFKASNDNMKEHSIAKVAAQCEEFYGEVYKLIQTINYSNKISIAEWVEVFNMKQHAYAGVAEYYQAVVAQQKKEFGEQITRLTKALEHLKSIESKLTIPMANKFKEITSKATQLLEEVKRDNDFIYHAKVPDHKTLPAISKAMLAKPTDLPNRYLPAEPDLFQHLLPFGMHQSIQKLEHRKQEVVNSEIASLREMTQTLNAILASLNLPAAIEDTKGVEVPKSLREKAAEVREKGGVNEIERLISELPDLLQRNREILDEIERSLISEEESDTNLKSQFKDRWTRTPSAKLNQTWRDHIAKYRCIIQKAIEADNKLKANYQANIDKMRLLSSPSDNALTSAIPSSNTSSANFDESAVNKLKQLMVQVESLKKEREDLETEVKNIEFEELKSKFMNSLSLHTGVDESSLTTETIGEFYGSLQKRVRESQEKQEKLIEEIRRANEQFTSQRGNGGNKRDQFMKELAAAYESFIQLNSNLKEGTKFYNDLTQLLVNLQVKVNDFCFARKAEREELCKDLQNEIVGRANDPVPAAPTYQKPEPVASVPPAAPITPATVAVPPTTTTYPPGQPPYPAYPYPTQPAPYNYYPPPPMPSGYNPYMMPQTAYYPPSYYPGQPGQPGYPGYPQPPQS